MSGHVFSAEMSDTATIEAQEREAARHQQWIDRALTAESKLARLEGLERAARGLSGHEASPWLAVQKLIEAARAYASENGE